jgi:hypothetical protein
MRSILLRHGGYNLLHIRGGSWTYFFPCRSQAQLDCVDNSAICRRQKLEQRLLCPVQLIYASREQSERLLWRAIEDRICLIMHAPRSAEACQTWSNPPVIVSVQVHDALSMFDKQHVLVYRDAQFRGEFEEGEGLLGRRVRRRRRRD